jgi:hypothetical protein
MNAKSPRARSELALLPGSLVLALAALLTGCRAPRARAEPPLAEPGGPTAPGAQPAPAPDEGELELERALVTREGRLQGGVLAIGGEHTGWILREGEGGAPPGLEIDPGPWLARARELDGQRVRVRGLWQTLRYVERGEVRVLALRELAPLP